MTALIDSENFEMPQSMFEAEFVVTGDDKFTAEICIKVPEFMCGIDLDGKEFEYNSYGFLFADLNKILDDYIGNYKNSNFDLEDAEFLKNEFIKMSEKLKKFIEIEHLNDLAKNELKEGA